MLFKCLQTYILETLRYKVNCEICAKGRQNKSLQTNKVKLNDRLPCYKTRICHATQSAYDGYYNQHHAGHLAIVPGIYCRAGQPGSPGQWQNLSLKIELKK